MLKRKRRICPRESKNGAFPPPPSLSESVALILLHWSCEDKSVRDTEPNIASQSTSSRLLKRCLSICPMASMLFTDFSPSTTAHLLPLGRPNGVVFLHRWVGPLHFGSSCSPTSLRHFAVRCSPILSTSLVVPAGNQLCSLFFCFFRLVAASMRICPLGLSECFSLLLKEKTC